MKRYIKISRGQVYSLDLKRQIPSLDIMLRVFRLYTTRELSIMWLRRLSGGKRHAIHLYNRIQSKLEKSLREGVPRISLLNNVYVMSFENLETDPLDYARENWMKVRRMPRVHLLSARCSI